METRIDGTGRRVAPKGSASPESREALDLGPDTAMAHEKTGHVPDDVADQPEAAPSPPGSEER